MQITRTINSDKRYYIDEDMIINSKSLLDTIKRFNDMKMKLYNVLYDDKYNGSTTLSDCTYSSWMKEQFGTNDYYNCAVYSYASGIISSQEELKKLYIKTKEADIKARKNKIKSATDKLERKQKIKSSIVLYIKDGKWKRPYSGCQTKVAGKSVNLPGNKVVDIDEYERMIEKDIRQLKTRISLLSEAKKRAESKLANLRNNPPKRVLFGTKGFYRRKDSEDVNIDEWKCEFSERRYSSISFPGRHTSKDCNFLVRRPGIQEMRENPDKYFNPNLLVIKCIDGEETLLKDFHLSRCEELWRSEMLKKGSERKAICYNVNIRKDINNRIYLVVSVTLQLENRYCNESFEDGCVSIDLNYDHVVLSDIDKDGNLIESNVIHFSPETKTNGQISDEIGRVMSIVGAYCSFKKKPLVMEDLDTTISKNGMRYGNAKRNRHASIFAYKKMTACLENQSYERSFGIIKINPAYTSQIGKILYMRKKGISIHSAASYAIGLKGMGLLDKLIPDDEMIELLPEEQQAALKSTLNMDALMTIWKTISSAFSKVYTHSFYKPVPYECLKLCKRKPRKPLKKVANEMESWTSYKYYC